MKNHVLLRLVRLSPPCFPWLIHGMPWPRQQIVVEQPALTVIADGGTKAFGNVPVGSPVVLTFTVRNTGDAPLTLGVPTIDGVNAAEFGASTPSRSRRSSCHRHFHRHLHALDHRCQSRRAPPSEQRPGCKNPYDINLTATGTAPDISVTGSGAFGNVQWGGAPVTRSFTIYEPRHRAAQLGACATIIGPNAAEFSVTTAAVSPVAAGGITTFDVTRSATSRGSKVATMHFPQ